MDRTVPTELSDFTRKGAEGSLKQIATTDAAAAAGATALPAWAQEKPSSQAASDVPAGQPLVAETLRPLRLKYEDLPPEVVRVAKRIIVESIGCGIGAFSAETSQIANKLAAGVSAVRGATVMRRRQRWIRRRQRWIRCRQ